MPYCKNCGAEISAGSNFCGSCGTNVTSAETKKKISAEAHAGEKVKSKKKGCKKGCLTPLFILFIAGLAALYYFYQQDPGIVGGTGMETGSEEVEEVRELTGTDIPGIVSIEDDAVNNDPEVKVRAAESGDFRKASDLVEKAFSAGDTVLLKQMLTPASLERYKGVFGEISPYMNEYASAFKNRKLVISGPIYALYEFSNGSGRKFTAEFALGDDGDWKLVRF